MLVINIIILQTTLILISIKRLRSKQMKYLYVLCLEDVDICNRVKLDCKHIFHEKCINKWIQTNMIKDEEIVPI